MLPVEQLLGDCDVERLRRSGPGGQHRNKVETAVRITHRPSGVTAMASEQRSQSANLAQAVRRLKINLALHSRTPAGDVPSPLWRSRCADGRIHLNTRHADFPSLLAEALNTLQAAGWNLAAAADALGCTHSQLVKLLRQEPRAFAQLNRHRTAQNQNPYQ